MLGQITRHGPSIVDVFLFLFVGRALRQHARLRQQWFQQPRGFFQRNAFVPENFGDRAQQRIRISCGKREQQFGQLPVGADAGKNLLMFYLPGHDCAMNPGALKSFDQLRQFSKREPMNGGSAVRFDFRRRFFLDRRDDNFISLRARGLEHEKGKCSVAGDEANLFLGGHCKSSIVKIRKTAESV